MKSALLFGAFLTLCASKIVLYEGNGEGCDTLLYAESFSLINGVDDVVDLTGIPKESVTASCSMSKNGDNGVYMGINFGDVNDKLKGLDLNISFTATTTGYWNSEKMRLKYNDGSADLELTGDFNIVSVISKSFSFACSLETKISLTESGGTRDSTISLNMYQIQAYNVVNVTGAAGFSDNFQCVGWISKGAWMGVTTGLVMIIVLVLSVMMLLGVSTPDRFETSKSKCLIIPHEH